MRFFFYSLIFLVLLCVVSVLVVDTMTGRLSNSEGCSGGHVYAFYRTPEEKERVEYMWYKAGFFPVAREQSPASFGDTNFLCLRRLTDEEKKVSEVKRESVVNTGSSYR